MADWTGRRLKVVRVPSTSLQLARYGPLGSFCKITPFFVSRAQPFRQHLRPPAGWCRTRLSPPSFPSCSEGRTLAMHLASVLHDFCGKAYSCSVRLECHSVGRGTRFPTENTDACGWTDCVSRTEPTTVGTRAADSSEKRINGGDKTALGVFSKFVYVEDDPADRERHQRPPANQLSVRPLHWRL